MRTSLYHWHLKQGGKVVDFHGFELPVHYTMGQVQEHLNCRSSVGLFDVSHMGQIIISGSNIGAALEKILPIDTDKMSPMTQGYTMLLNENGGVLDDLIVGKLADNSFRLVVNASMKYSDLEWIQQHLPQNLTAQLQENLSLIALQGPHARSILSRHCPELSGLKFNHIAHSTIDGIDILVSCCGYTGEDGFEISVADENCEQLATILASDTSVTPCGLGARDTLRLEAGLCLYGSDLTLKTTPIEAKLLFTIQRSRRPDGNKSGGYIGSERIQSLIKNGCKRVRCGIISDGKIPMRAGTELFDNLGNCVGMVTSGCKSPSLNKPIALAYVNTESATLGTQLTAKIRNKEQIASIQKLPFIQNNYFH